MLFEGSLYNASVKNPAIKEQRVGKSFILRKSFILFSSSFFFFVDVPLVKRVSIERNVEDTTIAFRPAQRTRSA